MKNETNTEKKLKPYDSTEPTVILRISVTLEKIKDIQRKRFSMCFICISILTCILKMTHKISTFLVSCKAQKILILY